MKVIYNALSGEMTQREFTPEELAQMQEMESAPQPEISYEQRVVNLIRQQYSVDDEIGINRQKESKPDEWQEYYDYCEWAKNEANTVSG